MTPGPIVDLFAGPGGWDIALRALRAPDAVGIEYDRDACATRAAVGLPTIRADVAHYPPPPQGIHGLIASPPCQAFSAAGLKGGRDHSSALAEALHAGRWDYRPDPDPNVWLALEVGRWVDVAHPRWVALEQVPAVLPLWEALAARLRDQGYSTWTGVLNAADYGTPQVRRRAVLLADLDQPARPPDATHAADPTPGLFGDLAPWVTMADALGWPPDAVAGRQRRNDRDDGHTHRVRDLRPADQPAFTVSSKAQWWEVLNTGRDWKKGGTRDDAQKVPSSRPSPAVTHQADAWRWAHERPATTITSSGAQKVMPPGHRYNQADIDRLGEDEARRRYTDRAGTDGIPVTLAEVLVLQDFPPDYPVQGSKRSQFQQVGNAVPPGLAAAVLSTLNLNRRPR